MRRLFWLALGFVLAWYGFSLISGGDAFAAYRLRDGLIVALLGALLFAWNTSPLAPLAIGGERQWPLWGRIFTGTGIICGAAAAVLMALWGGQSWAAYMGSALWGVGGLSMLLGLFWPSRVEIYPAPAYRWGVDAAGNYVRFALDDPSQPVDPAPSLATWSHPVYWGLVALLLIAGLFLRFWHLASLPPNCVDIECALALRLVEGSWPQGFNAEAFSLFGLLASLLYRYTGDGITALRWAGAILGALALPVTFWAARAYVKAIGGLIALLVMALLPWAVWSSRFGTVWSAAPLLLALTLGLAGYALTRSSYRWWGLTGVSLALLLAQPLPLWGATLAWMVILAGAAVWAQAQAPSQTIGQTQRGAWRAWIDHAAVMAGCALAFGLPLAIPFWNAGLAAGVIKTGPDAVGPLVLVAGLLDSGGATLDYFMHQPLLPAWAAALSLLGLAALLRWIRQPQAAIVALGALIYGAAVLIAVPPMLSGVVGDSSALLALPIISPSEAWLVLLPFIAIAGGAAGDQLISAFDRAWAILLPLPRVVLVVTLLMVILAGQETWLLMGQLGHATGSAQNETQTAIGQYLANCLRGEVGNDPCTRQGPNAPIFYVPSAILNQPATRLLLGAALENDRVRAFDPSRDLLPSTTPTGDLFYLVAIEDQPVIDLMQQLYPTAILHAEPTDQGGPTRFLVIQIPLADVLAHQGLAGQYYAGATPTGTAQETRLDGPIAFDWGRDRPIEGPFSVVWDGSLLVPAPGDYSFTLRGLDNPPQGNGGQAGPVVSVQLDGNLLLDSSLGLTAKTQQLAQGAYHFTMRYHTDGPTNDWALHWTAPGGVEQLLPREQFYSPTLPNIGLIGAYYDGSNWDGKLLALRKDMVLGVPVALPLPYSVDWTGKLAANRTGEYYFAVTANGPARLTIDGKDVLFHTPSSDPATGPGYSQAGIYLEQGWHDIGLLYAPSAASDLRVLWQPPGSGPLLLTGRYLLPTQAPVTMADIPLPPTPALVDATLGNDHFALSINMVPYRPVPSIPPSNLPLLASEQVWMLANGCGAGDSQFASPRGVAVDNQNGRVYVADSDNHRVEELMLSDGSHVTTYALSGFQEPVDVAIDPGGALLVLDATAQTIFRIDRATGEAAPLALNTGFYHPRGFTVDQGGNIIVADTGGARVVVLDASGAFLTQFGGMDSGLGQGQPTDALVLGNQLWGIAADAGRLWRLDNMGNLPVSERASTVSGPQLAALPDNSGFFMSDPVRRTVLYFISDGQPIGQLGYNDTFINPMGVAATYGKNGLVNLIVSDSAACTVSLWRLRTR